MARPGLPATGSLFGFSHVGGCGAGASDLAARPFPGRPISRPMQGAGNGDREPRLAADFNKGQHLMKRYVQVASVGVFVSCAAWTHAAGTAAVLRQSLALQPGDDASLPLAEQPGSVYLSVQGERELNGHMIVRPLSRDAWQARGMTAADADEHARRSRARLAPLEWLYVAEHGQILITLPAGVDENQMAAFLLATGEYEYAEPDWTVFPCLVPNDLQYASQYTHQLCGSEVAWNLTTGSASVTIGVTDTGVRTDHEDLAANLVSGANTANVTAVAQAAGGAVSDINGHGSHTAGIAGARGGNGVGVCGMTWNCRIMPVRVTDSTGGSTTLSAIQAGATWAAAHGARIVSTSYSGANTASNQTVGATLRSSYNALWFWAAGNAATDLGADSYPDLQIVSSTDSADALSSFSNYGLAVDIAAPGSSILSTYNGSANSYATLSGTSMACPAAAGAASLILSVNPSLTATQVRDILYTSADDLGTPGRDSSFGYGRINVGKATAAAYRRSFPLALPFADDFESGSLAAPRWVYVETGCLVRGAVAGAPSGTSVAEISGSHRIETNAINLSGNLSPIDLTFSFRAQSIEVGKSLNIEYLSSSGAWIALATIAGPRPFDSSFTTSVIPIPTQAGARHAAFALRFRTVGSDAGGIWQLDNILLAPHCNADFNQDQAIDLFDYLDFVEAFGAGSGAADFNSDGAIDFFDYLDFVAAFTAGC